MVLPCRCWRGSPGNSAPPNPGICGDHALNYIWAFKYDSALDWDFDRYNGDIAATRAFLQGSGAQPMTVPYRANRAVIFDSDLFHETDVIRFREGYPNRRINVTLLYGERAWTGRAKKLLLRHPTEEEFMRVLKSLLLGAALLSATAALAQTPAAPPPIPMGLTSTSFADGAVIPDKYTQASPAPVSPALAWTNPPAGTVSFALVVDDPDTALQHTTNEVLHWAAFNIPATATSLPEGVPNDAALPDGTVQPLNTGKKPGFMGPGARGNVYHHYTFQLYALDTKLALGPDATRAQILAAMDGHVLGKAVLVGRFHRPLM